MADRALFSRDRNSTWLLGRYLSIQYLSLRFQTASSILSFIIAALTRPEVQTMAQEELDAVTRRERLPVFEDRPRLPFVNAICQEVLRWRPVTPLGELPSSTQFTCTDV